MENYVKDTEDGYENSGQAFEADLDAITHEDDEITEEKDNEEN